VIAHHPHGFLDQGGQYEWPRFQIQLAALGALLEDQLQQTAYFTRDFLLDRVGCFFSCDVRVSSTGRARQIFSLVSTKVRLSC